MKNVAILAIVALSFVWAGLLMGISFIETPLKFQAPGVTLLIGVGIGNLVFHALNNVETILFLLVLAGYFFSDTPKYILQLILLTGLVLLIQMYWLMPNLDLRIAMMQKGTDPAPSSIHLYYVAGEILKIILLLILGIKTFYYKQDKISQSLNTSQSL